jgi:hypothetical protein
MKFGLLPKKRTMPLSRIFILCSLSLVMVAALLWLGMRLSPCTSTDIAPFTKVTLKDALSKNDLGRITVADINKDGHPDLIAGGRWYEGPQWDSRVFYVVDPEKYIDGARNDVYDVDSDGYIDILGNSVPVRGETYRELFWLKNPGPPYTGTWGKYLITTNYRTYA